MIAWLTHIDACVLTSSYQSSSQVQLVSVAAGSVVITSQMKLSPSVHDGVEAAAKVLEYTGCCIVLTEVDVSLVGLYACVACSVLSVKASTFSFGCVSVHVCYHSDGPNTHNLVAGTKQHQAGRTDGGAGGDR